MEKPEKRIHCLSSSIQYILESKKIFIDENLMMLSPLAIKINEFNDIDTKMNEAIWMWVYKNLEYISQKGNNITLEKYSLLYIPLKYLKYAEVYKYGFVQNKKHFVVIVDKTDKEIKIFDSFIPTIPITEKTFWIKISDIDKADIECKVISGIKNIQKQKKIFEENFCQDARILKNILNRVKILNQLNKDATLDLIGDLGESSLEGSRKFLVDYYSKAQDPLTVNFLLELFSKWQSKWIGLRINLYKFYLTRKASYLESALHDINSLTKVDKSIFLSIGRKNIYE